METTAAAVVPAPAPVLDVQDAAEAAERRAEAHAEVLLAADEAELRAGDPAELVDADAAEVRALEPAAEYAEPAQYDEPRESLGFEAPPPALPTTALGADAPSESEAHFAPPATPAEARLGAEGLGRLRARYAEVMARIAEKPMDEPAREELKISAARLNPDDWVTADEVSAALEQYETVFESLRAVVGRHPPRRRRR